MIPLNGLFLLVFAADRTIDRIATPAVTGIGTRITQIVPAYHMVKIVCGTREDEHYYHQGNECSQIHFQSTFEALNLPTKLRILVTEFLSRMTYAGTIMHMIAKMSHMLNVPEQSRAKL